MDKKEEEVSYEDLILDDYENSVEWFDPDFSIEDWLNGKGPSLLCGDIPIPSVDKYIEEIKNQLLLIEKYKHSTEGLTNKILPKDPDFINWMKQILSDPNYYKELLKPMGKTKYKYLIIPGEFIPDGKKEASSKDKRTAYDLIKYTIEKRDDMTSHFITDDNTGKYIGFVSYGTDSSKTFVYGIKMLRFDDGSIIQDVLDLIQNKLLNIYKGVGWEAILDLKNPVIKPYNSFFKHLKRKGYKTKYRERVRNGKRIACYLILSKVNK